MGRDFHSNVPVKVPCRFVCLLTLRGFEHGSNDILFCPLIPGDVTSGTKDVEIKVVICKY